MKKLIALLLAVVMVLGVFAGCSNNTDDTPDTTAAPNAETTTPAGTDEVVASGDTYTYHAYATSLGTNWNPHTWEMSGDSDIMAYIETPLVDISIKDSETGEYQWIFLAATNIEDVTAEYQDDLTKYGCSLPEGVTADQVTEGYVYKITLNPEMCWQDGTPINADTYIYSMQQLLAPEMKNYRANNYYSGESAMAGAYDYFYSDVATITSDLATLGYANAEDAQAAGLTVCVDMWGFWGLEGCVDEAGNECPQYVDITDTTLYRDAAVAEGEDGDWISAADIYAAYGAYFTAEGGYLSYLVADVANESYGATWDGVGLYKEDDYTIVYVCQSYYDYYYFLTSCTSNWLVYEELYEAGKDTTGTLVTTDYNTAVENTMGYGPYKIESLQDGKQIVFTRNENYFEYEYDENGNYVGSTSFFEVDGENVEQFLTDKIVIDVMTDDAAKQAFMKGEVDSWTPAADEVVNYTTSEQLYQVDETYTMRFFFNCNVDNLKVMDESYGNTNSVVLSNENFRKAMSLAIDRDEFVTATAGYKAAYYILNYLYFYDVYEDPSSIYRNSDEAMQAICNLYGVEYGEGTPYATLADAYNSINGYNLTEAKNLMTQACQELVAEGLYTEGEDIVIRIGWSKGAMGSSDQQQVALLNEYINAAVEGTGFGKVTFEAVDNLSNRYASVANGEFAIGWGAWGGAAFYPFTMFRVYCDTTYADIHEIGSWDPSTTNLTLTVNGEEVTMTWQDWSVSMTGTGAYADADNETKLNILSQMEENYLELYYCIPMCTTTACYLLSYKVSYYTEEYSIMYGFGGTRLMQYNYTDAEWADYVAGQGGTLSYE